MILLFLVAIATSTIPSLARDLRSSITLPSGSHSPSPCTSTLPDGTVPTTLVPWLLSSSTSPSVIRLTFSVGSPISIAISQCARNIRYSPCMGVKHSGLSMLKIIFSSSCLACPDTWTGLAEEVMTLTLRSAKLLSTSLTATSLPGMVRADSITVSLGLSFTSRWSSRAILTIPAANSPCEPVVTMMTLWSGRLLASAMGISIPGGMWRCPVASAISEFSIMLLPSSTILRFNASAASAIICTRAI